VILKGSFQNVGVQAANSTVELTCDNVQDLIVKADGMLTFAEGTTVTNLNVQSAARATGQGSIENATVSAQGATFEQKPANLQVGDNLTTTVAGELVSGNTTATGVVGGGGAALVTPVTSTALAPTASNITFVSQLGSFTAKGTATNLTVDLPGAAELSSLQADINTASKLEIVDLLNGKGDHKLD
jgi:hypothetical protein